MALAPLAGTAALVTGAAEQAETTRPRRYDIEFNFEEWAILARDVYGITDPQKCAAWVDEQFQKIVDTLNSLRPDDCFVYQADDKFVKVRRV